MRTCFFYKFAAKNLIKIHKFTYKNKQRASADKFVFEEQKLVSFQRNDFQSDISFWTF